MKFALLSLIFGFCTALVRIFSPTIIDEQTYVDAFRMLNYAAILGSFSIGVNARIDQQSLKNQIINVDGFSIAVLSVGFIIFALLGEGDINGIILLILISITFGFQEAMSNIFNYSKNLRRFAILELLYSICIISLFFGMYWNILIICFIILIIQWEAKPLRLIFHKTWKIRDRVGIGFSSIITYMIPIIFSVILDKDDAVSFLASFSLASLLANISITIQQKTSLSLGFVSRRSLIFLSVVTLITSFCVLASTALFEIMSYISSNLFQTFSLSVFVGTRVLHTSSLLYDRLNLNGETDFFVLQLQRLALMALTGALNYYIFESIPLLLLTLAAVNLLSSIGVLIKR